MVHFGAVKEIKNCPKSSFLPQFFFNQKCNSTTKTKGNKNINKRNRPKIAANIVIQVKLNFLCCSFYFNTKKKKLDDPLLTLFIRCKMGHLLCILLQTNTLEGTFLRIKKRRIFFVIFLKICSHDLSPNVYHCFCLFPFGSCATAVHFSKPFGPKS